MFRSRNQTPPIAKSGRAWISSWAVEAASVTSVVNSEVWVENVLTMEYKRFLFGSFGSNDNRICLFRTSEINNGYRLGDIPSDLFRVQKGDERGLVTLAT
jgi:hypothetical protein